MNFGRHKHAVPDIRDPQSQSPFPVASRARMAAFPSFTADARRVGRCRLSVQIHAQRDRRKDEGGLYQLNVLKQTATLTLFPKADWGALEREGLSALFPTF